MSHPTDPQTAPAIDRRTFVKTLSTAGLGVAAFGSSLVSAAESAAAVASGARRKRYAIVGVGARHVMYQDAIEKTYPEHAELVAFCDTNPGRLEVARKRSETNSAKPPPAFLAKDFDRMLREAKPEYLIVTTMDSTHDEYIVRAMEAGVDVISEKPMTTTAEKAQRILDAKKKTGRNLRVTFNYRYSPPRTQVKDMLMAGEIGDLRSVDFHWMLNTHHGADYFRRWHGNKKNSGGLMIHKASHHFDLVNWWVGAIPAKVMATGQKEFYTPEMARRLGLQGHHERCHTCPEKDKCTFFYDLAAQPNLKSLYLDQEKHDGYFRDQCVFNPRIDIEDTMNVLVTYENKVTLSYSLNAFNAWEGYTIVFNGTKGRIEHSMIEQVYGGDFQGVLAGVDQDGVLTKVYPLRGPVKKVEPWSGVGSHGGGDKVMLDEIFLPSAPADKYKRASDERAGTAAILVGIAANKCFETGQAVDVAKLLRGFTPPELAPMPGRTLPLSMPPRLAPTRSSGAG